MRQFRPIKNSPSTYCTEPLACTSSQAPHCKRFIEPGVFVLLFCGSQTLLLWSVSCEKKCSSLHLAALHTIYRTKARSLRNYNSGHAGRKDAICIARNYNVCFCVYTSRSRSQHLSHSRVAESTKTRVRACCNADEALVIKPLSRTT